MTKKIVVFLTVLILVSISIASFATTSGEINNKINEINSNIDDAENRQDEINDEKEAIIKEVEALNAEIEQKEDEIATLNSELKTLNAEIEELQKQINEQERKYNEQYELFCKRAVAQYKTGKATYLDVLLNSKSLSEFVSKYYLIQKIAELDKKLLNEIEQKKTEIEASKKELDSKQDKLKEKQSKLKLEEITLTNKKGNKNKYISQLNEEDRKLQEQIDQWMQERKEAENELAEIARQNANNSGGYTYSGGQLLRPCNYTRISSYFGYRGASATGGVGSSNHKGMDFAAPKGTSIVAAESGVVIKVVSGCSHNYPKTYSTRCSCGGGFGNYVMVSHGGGLVTLYGHCTSINVSVGQTVARGQQIATVGSTGYSTGNHLHFGVLLNGTYVNPASYLGL